MRAACTSRSLPDTCGSTGCADVVANSCAGEVDATGAGECLFGVVEGWRREFGVVHGGCFLLLFRIREKGRGASGDGDRDIKRDDTAKGGRDG